MNEREARDAVRPSGNVTPLPRMQEPSDESFEWEVGDVIYAWGVVRSNGERVPFPGRTIPIHEPSYWREQPYPEAPLASRGAPNYDLGRFPELAQGIQQRGALSGVRLWMTWPGQPDMAAAMAGALAAAAETMGLSVLDVQVAEMEP